jgi:hypothetical protein
MTAREGPAVRLTSNNRAAELQVLQSAWTSVCNAPCGYVLDPTQTYRVAGRNIQPSDEFSLPRSTGFVDVHAHVTSKTKRWVGVGLVLGGLSTVVLGGLIAGNVIKASSTTSTGDSDYTAEDALKLDGVLVLTGGVIVTVIGIALSAISTSVEVQ